MHLAACDDVHFCLLDERIIFLDARRDRYVAASPEASAALLRALAGTSRIGEDEVQLKPLVDGDLITVSNDSTQQLRLTSIGKPTAEFGPSRRGTFADLVMTIWFQLRAAHRLRKHGFGPALVERRELPRLGRHRPAETLLGAFQVSHFLYSPHARCLPKSMGLFDLLRRAGHAPSLIIGVRDYPFNAHAWVQLGSAVIGDDLDRVEQYEPILVI